MLKTKFGVQLGVVQRIADIPIIENSMLFHQSHRSQSGISGGGGGGGDHLEIYFTGFEVNQGVKEVI